MLHIDADRPLTPLQLRVLRVVRAIGPCPLGDVFPHFRERSTAVRLAVYTLRQGGWMFRLRSGDYDVSAATRQWLAQIAKQPPEPELTFRRRRFEHP